MYDKDQLINLPTQIAQLLDKTLAQLVLLQIHAANLVELGIVNASTYYRDGIYLYLVHPTASDGSRQREYVGKDPSKIAAALARIARREEHFKVTCQIKEIETHLDQVAYNLYAQKRDLERLQLVTTR
jgi:hypothetical protein